MKKLINKIILWFGYVPLNEFRYKGTINVTEEQYSPIIVQAQCELSSYELVHAKEAGDASEWVKNKLRWQILEQLYPFEIWEETDNLDGSFRYKVSIWVLNKVTQ